MMANNGRKALGNPFARSHGTVPEDPRILAGIKMIRAGVPTMVIAKKLKVECQSVDRWYFRWVVYPDWVAMQKSEPVQIALLRARIAELERNPNDRIKELEARIAELEAQPAVLSQKATVRIERLKQYIRDHCGVEVDI